MTALPIPIYILKKGEVVPRETCYVVTRDGVFLHKLNGLVESLIRVEGICFLESVEPKAILHLPKIPAVTMARALVFFRQIHKKMDSEANLMVHYRPDRKKYRLACPLQEVSMASVDYGAEERLEGYQLVGTVHSHNRMSAFHSGTDKIDESCFDGLHITIGSLDQFPKFSISCSVVVNGQRFKIEPEEIVNGIDKAEPETVLAAASNSWIADITESVDQGLMLLLDPISANGGFTYPKHTWTQRELYELVLPRNKRLDLITFPPQWLGKIKKKSFFLTEGGLRI
ncbi:MAG: Mov34/MPN/PAD-1 family protein [Parcubacteria group bacterium]|nr:Mov34/MPN/PAD-1 family protein [Parcubacteria group bacterium]